MCVCIVNYYAMLHTCRDTEISTPLASTFYKAPNGLQMALKRTGYAAISTALTVGEAIFLVLEHEGT